MNDELYSKSMINNEKQTSVAKLVNQLCIFFPVRHLLNMHGTIKSDGKSRISIRCATLIYLSHLSII
ncbi:unnamed protein product [Rotaria sordida]|uniref:Uncharacterized protein n=1 Tax=Rotaria sordida TaxID=392033 RepID=A0A816DGL8_9BILA|nr:unnamed protein product [Rotaria sordida]CAF1638113.1 unnamed protein product [Rotaria sordida]